jgi:hypothetical protein
MRRPKVGGAKRAGEHGHTFVQVFHYIMDTAAWRDLDAVSRCVYLEVKRFYTGSNNGRIGLSCRQAADALGMSAATCSRAFQRLVDHGFLEEVVKGVPARGSGFNRATEWLLDEYRDDQTGRPPKKRFLSWSKSSSPVSNTASHVASMQRDGNGVPLGPRARFMGATSKAVSANSTLHQRNTLTSSQGQHPHSGLSSAAPVASEPSKASAQRRGQAVAPDATPTTLISYPIGTPSPAGMLPLGPKLTSAIDGGEREPLQVSDALKDTLRRIGRAHG